MWRTYRVAITRPIPVSISCPDEQRDGIRTRIFILSMQPPFLLMNMSLRASTHVSNRFADIINPHATFSTHRVRISSISIVPPVDSLYK